MNILILHIIRISLIGLGRNLRDSKCNRISYIFDNFHHIRNKYLMNGLTLRGNLSKSDNFLHTAYNPIVNKAHTPLPH